jgi:RNA polymerase sigma factor (sigma-70 family)
MAGAEVVRAVRRLVEPPRYAQATDRELLGCYLAERDETAFEALARRHARLVRASVGGVLTDPNDIDDALQATFLVLLRRAPETKWDTGLGPWLYGVAHRVAVKLRATALRRPGPLGTADPLALPEPHDAGLREACDLLHTELDRLPDRYRLPLLLCYLEGQTRDEAAAALGISVGTVKGRVRRGCDLLRRRLTRRGVSLSLGLLAAVATPQPTGAIELTVIAILRGTCSSRAFLLAREMTMRSFLGKATAALTAAVLVVGLGAGLMAGGGVEDPPGGKIPPGAAAPAPADGLRFVPADSAVFLHVDVQKLMSGPLGSAARTSEPKMMEALTAIVKRETSAAPESLESVTVFWPRIRVTENPGSRVGIVLAFRKPYDKEGLVAAINKRATPGGPKSVVYTPSDRIALILTGLGKDYSEPRAADATGPLASTIREAATGKHILVVGVNPAELPAELRNENQPDGLQGFRPILDADAFSLVLDLGKEWVMDLRVQTATPAKAVEAEKALGLFTKLLQRYLALAPKELEIDPEKEPASKDLSALLNALQTGVKEAKFTTDGTEARLRIALPGDLHYVSAIAMARAKALGGAILSRSSNNLKQIALAMLNYESAYNALPPAAVVDKAGKPMLSWRVLILPFIEQNELYKEFRLDEPWDSEHNKKLISKMPSTYAIPDDTLAKAGETRYRVFVGNGAGFEYIRGAKITDITDGTSNTIMVVTAADAVPWTKPDELAFDPDKNPGKLLGMVDGRTYQAAMFDGSVRAFNKLPAAKTLKAFITRAGGEVINNAEMP